MTVAGTRRAGGGSASHDRVHGYDHRALTMPVALRGSARHRCGLTEWEREHERRAVSRRRLDPDPAAVGLDDPAAHGEPQTGAAGRGRAAAAELEDPLLRRRLDPAPVVADEDDDLVALAARADL